jgi:hypothetical protein
MLDFVPSFRYSEFERGRCHSLASPIVLFAPPEGG